MEWWLQHIRLRMFRRQLIRIPLLATLYVLATSFGLSQADPELALPDSTMRLSRGFAAGLEFIVAEPADVPEGAELPMVVYIHGRGDMPPAPTDTPFGVDAQVRWIFPRGPARSGDGYAWMPVSAHRGESPELLRALDESSRALSEAMMEWRRRYPTRGLPIVVGFSQGGMLAMDLAVTQESAISHAFPIAGWLPPSRAPRRAADPYAMHVNVLALHGGADPILSPARTERTLRALSALGYPMRFETFDGVEHELSVAMRERLKTELEAALEELPESGHEAGHS